MKIYKDMGSILGPELKIDGDVPYLYLEILPLLQKNVYIHIHDVPFPYNCPYPAKLWVLELSLIHI